MERLIFGTKNEAKVKQISGALSSTGITIEGLPQNNLPEIEEDGKTAVENARKKAIIYANSLGEKVFSMDNALSLVGLQPEEQPGLHVRRLIGFSERPTDQEMIEYYSGLISSINKRIDGYWEYGMCIATPDGSYKETTIKTPRVFVSNPSSVIQPGYPLESLQIEPESGRYMSELTQEEQDIFWKKTIGNEVLRFIQSVDF